MNIKVKKETLRKLSTVELKQYIAEESRYTSQAVRYAFYILQQERGVCFSAEEAVIIQQLIQRKEAAESSKCIQNKEYDSVLLEENVDKESSLFSKSNIAFLSIIFSPVVGAFLLFYNLKIVQKITGKNIGLLILYLLVSFIFIVLFAVVYDSYLRYFFHTLLGDSYLSFRYSETVIKMGFKIFINIVFIDYLWKSFFGIGKLYHSKNIDILIVVCLVIYAIAMFIL